MAQGQWTKVSGAMARCEIDPSQIRVRPDPDDAQLRFLAAPVDCGDRKVLLAAHMYPGEGDDAPPWVIAATDLPGGVDALHEYSVVPKEWRDLPRLGS